MTDEEVKNFVAMNISEYFKSTREEKNLRKVAKSLYFFLTTPDEVKKYNEVMQSNSSENCMHCYYVEILNIFNPESKLINNKPRIKNN